MMSNRWLNLFAFVVMIVMNFLANALPIGGLNTGEVSERFDNLFVPAGRTFAIWGVIYLFLGIFIIRSLIATSGSDARKAVQKAGPWISVNFLLNATWILAWHHLYIGLAWLIMTGILLSLVIVYIRMADLGFRPMSLNWWLVFVPFSIYLSWICVAMVANGAAFFTDLGFSFPWPAEYSVVAMGAAAILIAYLLTKRFSDPIPIWVLTWAFYGIFSKYAARDGVGSFPLTFFKVATIGLLVISIVGLYALVYRPWQRGRT